MLNFTNRPFTVLDLPQAEYIITDPGYLFDRDMWCKLCDDVFCNDDVDPSTGILEIEGHTIWWGGTHHGDGIYQVINKSVDVGDFCVDAGLFAIIPMSFFKEHCKGKDLFKTEGLAVKVEMMGRVYYEDGDLSCGSVSVQTSFGEEEEEEEEETSFEEDLEEEEEEDNY